MRGETCDRVPRDGLPKRVTCESCSERGSEPCGCPGRKYWHRSQRQEEWRGSECDGGRVLERAEAGPSKDEGRIVGAVHPRWPRAFGLQTWRREGSL